MEYERPTVGMECKYLKIREKLLNQICPSVFYQREVNAFIELFLQRIDSHFNAELTRHETRLGLHLQFMLSYNILKTVVTEYAANQFERFLKELIRLGIRLTIQKECYLAKSLSMLLKERFVHFFIFKKFIFFDCSFIFFLPFFFWKI